jgi:hypothetical protein
MINNELIWNNGNNKFILVSQPKYHPNFVSGIPHVLTVSYRFPKWIFGHREIIGIDFLEMEKIGLCERIINGKNIKYKLSHTIIYQPERDKIISKHIQAWTGLIIQTCEPRDTDLTWGRRIGYWEMIQ